MWCCCRNSKFCDAMLWHDSWDLESSWFTSVLNPGKGQGQPRCLRQQQVLTSTREVSFHLQQQSGCFLWGETKTVSDTREENWDLRKLYQCFASPPCGLGPHPPGSMQRARILRSRRTTSGSSGQSTVIGYVCGEIVASPNHSLDPTGHSLLFRHQSPWSAEEEMVTDEERNYQDMSMHT